MDIRVWPESIDQSKVLAVELKLEDMHKIIADGPSHGEPEDPGGNRCPKLDCIPGTADSAPWRHHYTIGTALVLEVGQVVGRVDRPFVTFNPRVIDLPQARSDHANWIP